MANLRQHRETDKTWLELGFVKCHHEPINETHLSDYILVPFEQVYEYTKELGNKIKQRSKD